MLPFFQPTILFHKTEFSRTPYMWIIACINLEYPDNAFKTETLKEGCGWLWEKSGLIKKGCVLGLGREKEEGGRWSEEIWQQKDEQFKKKKLWIFLNAVSGRNWEKKEWRQKSEKKGQMGFYRKTNDGTGVTRLNWVIWVKSRSVTEPPVQITDHF